MASPRGGQLITKICKLSMELSRTLQGSSTFKSTADTHAQLRLAGPFKELCRLIGSLTPSDLHVSEPLQREQGLVYQHIYGDHSSPFQIGIFLLPQSHTIPLHDHPHMTVVSKLLFGELHIKSYDWLEKAPPEPTREHHGTARLVTDGMMVADGPESLSVLHPDTGNIHELRAISDCAIFDLLLPPYSSGQHRSCHYYGVRTASVSEGEEGTVYLSEQSEPEDFYCGADDYHGPEPSLPFPSSAES
jgi:cysteamine dioxygenase